MRIFVSWRTITDKSISIFDDMLSQGGNNVMSGADQFVLARALYDNEAEAADELSFCKGDILTVVEFCPNGLEGWWLCSLRNKVGICPGNRLNLLGHVCCPADGVVGGSRTTSPTPSRHVRQASDPLRSFPSTLSAPVSPKPDILVGKDRRCVNNSNKVIIPQKVGDVYLYDVPDNKQSKLNVPLSGPPVGGHVAASPGPTSTYDTPRPYRSSGPTTFGCRSTVVGMYDVPRLSGNEESYDVPRSHHSSRRNSSEVGDYDVPRHLAAEESYDVPVQCVQSTTTLSADSTDAVVVAATYDVPRFCGGSGGGGDTPHRSSCVSLSSTSSSAVSPAQSGPSLTPSLSLSSLGGGSSSNRSSLERSHELYDIPKPTGSAASSSELYDVPSQTVAVPEVATPVVESVYDVPPQVTRDPQPFSDSEKVVDSKRLSDVGISSTVNVAVVSGKELPIELDAAMDMLVKLQQEVQSAINKLFTLLGSSSRQWETPTSVCSYDLSICCARVRTSLQDFLDFANGALVNSSKGIEKAVCSRLNKLLRPLHDANTIVQQTCQAIEAATWKPETGGGVPDDRDRLVACARTVVEDVRQVACFIQGNSTLIFKRAATKAAVAAVVVQTVKSESVETPTATCPGPLPPKTRDRPLPPTPPKGSCSSDSDNKSVKDENLYENDGGHWADDYDYVNLESKASFERKNEEIKASLPRDLRKSFDNLLKESLVQVDTSVHVDAIQKSSGGDVVRLDSNDRHVITFYNGQLEEHSTYLNNAIQAFLLTIENNQPPKIFVDHGKFVILGAHKLVFIGDTIHRNVFQPDVRHRVQRCADELCETLKTMVQRIKVAAQQFPSVIAVQEMVDSVVDVSQSASELKMIVAQVTKL